MGSTQLEHPKDGSKIKFFLNDGTAHDGFFEVHDFGCRAFHIDKHEYFLSSEDGGNVVKWKYI